MSSLAEIIDAVLLDAGGVLLLPDPDAVRAALAPFGVPEPDDATCHRNHYRLMREVDARMHGIDDYNVEPDWSGLDRTMVGFFGVAERHQDAARLAVRDVYLEMPWVPAPGAVDALLELQRAGMPLAVVSNATGDIEEQLAHREICSVDGKAVRVAVVVDSHWVGVSKPHPGIFQFALDALGPEVSPERCLYVGDTVHFDVKGARNAGLRPVHVNPHGLCPFDDHPHVGALSELPAWLSRDAGDATRS